MRAALAVGSVGLPLLVWWALLRLLVVPPMLGKTPLDVVAYVFTGPQAATVQSKLLAPLTATLPLVALTPLLVLLLGRRTAVTPWITVSVTFFPAYVLMAQGLALVPRATLDLPRAYGAGARTELRLVAIPASAPWIFAARQPEREDPRRSS